ncbi:MAG: hypothetical protein U1A07_13665, partial [Phenylobacterium sp.]|nr:hypothetical protein [Phenylobacterium sp.]
MSETTNKVVPLRPAATPETSRKVLEKRWTKGVIDPGFTFVPSVLLRAQARLHINATELAVGQSRAANVPPVEAVLAGTYESGT